MSLSAFCFAHTKQKKWGVSASQWVMLVGGLSSLKQQAHSMVSPFRRYSSSDAALASHRSFSAFRLANHTKSANIKILHKCDPLTKAKPSKSAVCSVRVRCRRNAKQYPQDRLILLRGGKKSLLTLFLLPARISVPHLFPQPFKIVALGFQRSHYLFRLRTHRSFCLEILKGSIDRAITFPVCLNYSEKCSIEMSVLSECVMDKSTGDPIEALQKASFTITPRQNGFPGNNSEAATRFSAVLKTCNINAKLSLTLLWHILPGHVLNLHISTLLDLSHYLCPYQRKIELTSFRLWAGSLTFLEFPQPVPLLRISTSV